VWIFGTFLIERACGSMALAEGERPKEMGRVKAAAWTGELPLGDLLRVSTWAYLVTDYVSLLC
jgi:hypothetical protein